MIGALIFRLRAVNTTKLPSDNGRYMHAVFFGLLQDCSSELAEFVHNELERKPFSLYVLRKAEKSGKQMKELSIKAGELFEWRVAVLKKELLQALAEVPRGKGIKVGTAKLVIDDIICDGEQHSEAGIVDEDELVRLALMQPRLTEISFRFISPVTFRFGDNDYPFPSPSLIFYSLAAKWTEAGMPGDMDKFFIREVCNQIMPLDWKGETRRVRFNANRWTLCFSGEFHFDVSMLDDEIQHCLLMLAQFAVFSGTGRMTGQGLGETRVMFKAANI